MADPEEQAKMEFPREFKACPDCGSTRRLSQATTTDEYVAPQEKGKTTVMMTMVHANQGPLTTVVAIGQIDACYDCGRVYSVSQNKLKFPTAEFSKKLRELGL